MLSGKSRKKVSGKSSTKKEPIKAMAAKLATGTYTAVARACVKRIETLLIMIIKIKLSKHLLLPKKLLAPTWIGRPNLAAL